MTAAPAHSFAPLEREYAAVIASLAARGADSLPHPGGTLLAHSKRTAHTLESWGASRVLTTAGLCHAAYGTQGYPTPLFEVGDRAVLRELIGDGAEAIVYAYGSLDRAHHLAQVSAKYEGAHSGEIRDRFSGEYWTPSEQLQRQLAELRTRAGVTWPFAARGRSAIVSAPGEKTAGIAELFRGFFRGRKPRARPPTSRKRPGYSCSGPYGRE